jgi:hypothetical protein
MPQKIQRVPRGLNDLLSISGGTTPVELEDRVRSTLELIQFYGLQQRAVFAGNNPAVAENVGVVVTPSVGAWIVLFGASATIIKTATMTALRASISYRLAGDVNQEPALASEELGPFGATETGAVSVVFRAPFPLILPPNTVFVARAQIIGTDATANVTVGVEAGILGG